MSTASASPATGRSRVSAAPLSLTIEPIAGMLNAELSDDPVYDGFELQWFDDDVHGTGMLAFLSRRADRTVDYYVDRALTVDRSGYEIGGGTRSWTETEFQVARFAVADDGVDAEVHFTDVDGRDVHVRVDDRDGRRRRRAHLLAPVGSGIDQPTALLLVWLCGFDLVRITEKAPVIRIGGRDASIGRLPAARLHRRHLIKYAAPVCAVQLNPDVVGALSGTPRPDFSADGSAVSAITAEQAGHTATVRFGPAMPVRGAESAGDSAATAGDTAADDAEGRWHVSVDGARLTGGTWTATRRNGIVTLGLDPDERWRPRRLPMLMRIVTTVVPVFRSWPTTYRWRAVVNPGPPPTVESGWSRTDTTSGQAYRRATGS